MKVLKNPSESEIEKCISKKEDFRVQELKQGKAVSIVEKILENKGYDYRTKTKGREASLVVPHPLNVVNAIGQVAHNIATFDPDWVIYKNAIGSTIDVKYFKG